MRAFATGLAPRPTVSAAPTAASAAMPAPRAAVGPPAIGLCAAACGDLPLSAALPAIRDLGHVRIDLPTDSTLRSLPGIDELEDPGFAQELDDDQLSGRVARGGFERCFRHFLIDRRLTDDE